MADPKENYLAPAHSLMRSSQPKHNAGSEQKHSPARAHTLGPEGTPRRHTPLRHELPHTPAPKGPLTAPQPPQAPATGNPRLQAAHLASTAVTGAVSPLTAGKPVPRGTRNTPRVGEQLTTPESHRQAIHHPATSAELQARNREREQ
jgi:hypothetical protein